MNERKGERNLIALSIHDYNRTKLADLYYSEAKSEGQAYDIEHVEELNGWKEVTFSLPYRVQSDVDNYRWRYIKSEYLLRYIDGEEVDWFVVNQPSTTKSGKRLSNKVYCEHVSALLKTKNLYLSLDDTNGIGTMREIAAVILSGTGWSLGECDMMYESDSKTEKIRTLKSDGKEGAYQ